MNSLEHLTYLERVAAALLVGSDVPRFPDYPTFLMEVKGFVEPKERARTGRNGHHYTPKDTREFEAKVRDEAVLTMFKLKLKRFNGPVAVHLQIYDKTPPDMPDWQVALARAGLYFEHTGGDLDNKEKAVLDALNKVVYTDDRLVVQNYKFRRFDKGAGFKIAVTLCGLTKTDILNIEKLMKHGRSNAKEEATDSYTR